MQKNEDGSPLDIIHKNLYDLGLDSGFLDMTPKERATKEK